MSRLLIRGARIVNEGRTTDGDVRVADGRIAAVGQGLGARSSERLIEAEGRYLLPGLIDDQVHFREPGLSHKADIATESAAAVAGGITSFFEMPNTKPPTVTAEALADKYDRAAGRARANYAFFFGATNDNGTEIEALDPRATPGIKVFMGASTGNMLVDSPEVLERVFAGARVPVLTHCEHTPTIEANERALRERIGDALEPHHHPIIRDTDACWRSSSTAVELARRHDTRLHVLHLTTARELELFEPGPIGDKRITCEACIHHLSFDDRDYAALGNRIKCNPAIKTSADRAALRQALREGRIDVLATDHAPHTLEEKAAPYASAPSGMPLVQDQLPALLELVAQSEVHIEQVVEKSSHNVARLFDVAERGFIREGYWADLVLADPNTTTEPRDATALAKCGWTPFDGRSLRGRVDATIVSGELTWNDGELTGAVPGQRVQFAR
jgi:dihydroorotase